MTPRLLDLFCGAGGAGWGYHLAGFDVTGVDIRPQPHYPLRFIQGDALDYLAAHGHEYDVIHASPPCQRYSEATKLRHRDRHPDLIAPTRDLLEALGRPYIIENVKGAARHLCAPVILCGLSFGLKVYRHRYFEIRPMILTPAHIRHDDDTPHSGHGLSSKGFVTVHRGGVGGGVTVEYQRAAMGIDWMTRDELGEAIPPAYTQYIGQQLLKAVNQ